jgi:DNA-binding response OmpR family regulator
MTASAIQGDREKCLDSGMNNYLAKPVKAATLKALLESYLSQEKEDVPNLQQEANKLVKQALSEAENGVKNGVTHAQEEKEGAASPSRPRSLRTNTTQRIIPHMTTSQSKPGPSS